MANSMDVLIKTILARGLMVLRETCLMPRLVNRSYSLSPKQRGQTVDVPVSTGNGVHPADATALTDTLAVDGLTITTGTYLKGDIITVAGHSQTYTVLADATASGSGEVTLTIAPGLKAAVADDAAVTLKASHTVNLGFYSEAFAFATAPFESDLMDNVIVGSLRDPISDIVLRLEVNRQYKQTKWEFDILWGSKCVRPQYAARLLG